MLCRYTDAAKYRDQLRDLEDKSKAAEASIEEATIQPQLRLGQRVLHKTKGYRGVVHGWDVLCCESEEWKKQNRVDKLSRGVEQIYYHVSIIPPLHTMIPHQVNRLKPTYCLLFS